MNIVIEVNDSKNIISMFFDEHITIFFNQSIKHTKTILGICPEFNNEMKKLGIHSSDYNIIDGVSHLIHGRYCYVTAEFKNKEDMCLVSLSYTHVGKSADEVEYELSLKRRGIIAF